MERDETGWGENRLAELTEFLAEYRVEVPNEPIARACGTLRANQRRSGKTLSTAERVDRGNRVDLGLPAGHARRTARRGARPETDPST